ncbi:S24 family peptidase [Vibrio parahaemolyticus]|uniref:S24 family peptidase n=1 Tax=Vibrio parahaemolyticus TaxID=670 RepID=UPI002F42A5A3|nr:S24 family peptidase [Vibrio parahaemolyticus]
MSNRLETLLKGRSIRKAAQEWGIAFNTLRNWINSDSKAPFVAIAKIAKQEDVDLNWLAYGETSTHKVEQSKRHLNVPKFGVLASAGGGSYIEEESVEDYYPFSLEYLRRLRVSHADLIIVEAHGDSMAPYIESGDDLLLKRVEFNADNVLSGVHVISIDGMLKVKRLQYSLQRNGYRIISDNPEYPEEFIGLEELMQDRMRVIGEVVMVMGRPSQPASQPAKD